MFISCIWHLELGVDPCQWPADSRLLRQLRQSHDVQLKDIAGDVYRFHKAHNSDRPLHPGVNIQSSFRARDRHRL